MTVVISFILKEMDMKYICDLSLEKMCVADKLEWGMISLIVVSVVIL